MSDKPTENIPEISLALIEETMPEKRLLSLAELIYQENLLKMKNMETAWAFQDWKAREESKLLSKISHWIISAWEIGKLIAGLRDGQFLCVDNQGKMYKGYVNPEKLKEIPQVVAKRIPSNLDLAEFTYVEMVTKSVAEPTVVSGFKPQWANTTRLANKNPSVASGILYFFMEIWQEKMKKNPEECHLDMLTGKLGDKMTVASIDGMSTKIVCNIRGNFVGYYYDENYTQVW